MALWTESVGKIFKLTSKSYGVRTVTYTQIKTVKASGDSGDFGVEVFCAEITARILPSKRAHSSGCKEGVIHLNEESILTPGSFGEECDAAEFEEISNAILAQTTTTLDRVMPHDPEGDKKIETPIDFPHVKLTDMEASLVRNSPFLIGNAYLLSANSRKAAIESVNQELLRASRNTRLADAVDPIYVAQKTAAIASLRQKLSGSSPKTNGQAHSNPPAEAPAPTAPQSAREPSAAPMHEPARAPAGQESSRNAPHGSRLFFTLIEKKNSIALALRGQASAASLSWVTYNPGKEGAVFRLGKEYGPLEFVQWAHVSGRAVSDQETARKNPSAFFNGPDASYSGPDQDGIHPVFVPDPTHPSRTA